MTHRFSLQNDSLTVRLDGQIDAQALADEMRSTLDPLPDPTIVIFDFTHATELGQAFKAHMYRLLLQHPKVARTLGAFGVNDGIFKDAKALLLGLAQARKVVVRDAEPDIRSALGLTELPKTRKFTGMLNYANVGKRDAAESTASKR
jgi:hypothetical protein